MGDSRDQRSERLDSTGLPKASDDADERRCTPGSGDVWLRAKEVWEQQAKNEPQQEQLCYYGSSYWRWIQTRREEGAKELIQSVLLGAIAVLAVWWSWGPLIADFLDSPDPQPSGYRDPQQEEHEANDFIYGPGWNDQMEKGE